MKATCFWILLIGSVSIAAHAALNDPGSELMGAASNVVFSNQGFLLVLGALAACSIYVVCMFLLGSVVGFNDLDRDQ
jgi:hypothetical protein